MLAVLALLAFLAFVCLRKKRAALGGASEPNRTLEARQSIEPGRGAELATKANTHEAPGSSKPGAEVVAMPYNNEKHGLQGTNHKLPENRTSDAVSPPKDTSELPTQFNKHELEHPSATYSPNSPDAINAHSSIGPDQLELASSPTIPELAGESIKRKPLPPQSPILRPSSLVNTDSIAEGSSSARPAGSPETDEAPSRLDVLQKRMERIRAEKERLAKERELEEMEAALQQEIMAELRKEHGSPRSA